MRNRYLLGAGVALAVALSWANAQAQLFALPPGPGALYFGIEGGWTNLEDSKGRVGALGFKQRWDDGYNVGAQPFGGEKLSGTGPKAGGPRYLHRFATERTLSVDTTAAGGNATLLSLDEEG